MKILTLVAALSLVSSVASANEAKGKKKIGHDKEHAHVESAKIDHDHEEGHHGPHDHKAHHPDHKDEKPEEKEDLKLPKKKK